MNRLSVIAASALLGALLAVLPSPAPASAQDAGQVKVAKGTAHIERGGQKLPARLGTRVRPGDVVVTGGDGSLGIAFADDSMLSIGPNSTLAIEKFAFDTTTHSGTHDTTLRQGTLSAVSGKIARQSPDAMKVRTPVAILGVRGTEFLVRTGE